MNVATLAPALDFEVPPELEASVPPEERGLGREGVRMMVSSRALGTIEHRMFADLPHVLKPGDLLVVNRSSTVNAALDGVVDEQPALLHLSRRLDEHRWIVELRHPDATGLGSKPWLDATAGTEIKLQEHGSAILRSAVLPGRRHEAVRLWVAEMHVSGGIPDYLAAWGRPIVYGHISVRWPLTSYQTIFAAEPGSAEMPSAGRPFTTDLVTRIFIGGVDLATVLLHSGVSSLEAHEPPDAEPFQVSAQAAQRVNAVHRLGGRVIAVGTTVVRALESAAVARGLVLPAAGLTDLVIDAAYSPRMVTGVLTGWHQPRASHLGILEAVAGRDLLRRSYREALGAGYLWHEFGDSHLILP